MKILITGAKGFIGKNLTEYLKDKHELLIPPHEELELLDELAVRDYFEKNQPEVVIHCANVGATRRTDNLPQIVGNNLRMFLNLARLEKHFKKMIFFGSGAEFDKRKALVKVNEDFVSTTLPESDYGFSKFLCSHFIKEHEKIINLRIFGVYGRYDDYENRFISNAICRAVLGLPIVVFQDQQMSFIFADDLVKIVEHFLTSKPKEKFYHTAASESQSLLDIAKKIKTISGRDIEIILKQPAMANEYTCDNSRLVEELGVFKFKDMDKSLTDLYKWYESHKDLIDPKKLPV